jgi:orotidine 5'-phosphate decarboxylase subfamily 1
MFLRKSPSQTRLADDQADQELQLSLTQLAENYPNAAMKQVLAIAAEKKSVIVLSADVETADQLLELIEKVGKTICVLKLHVDTIKNFNQNTLTRVLDLAKELNFVIMHDSKFSDIGSTVMKQYLNANYETAKWAPLVTAQAISGPGVLTGLLAGAKAAGKENMNGAILLAQMSSEGALTDDIYAAKAIDMAEKNMAIVAALVTQTIHSKYLLSFTPGVGGLAQAAKGDGLGQKYRTARDVISGGSHFLIIGRGIMLAENPAKEAEAYRNEAWSVLREEQHVAALKTRIELFKPKQVAAPH